MSVVKLSDKRLEKMFAHYSDERLDAVWESIERNREKGTASWKLLLFADYILGEQKRRREATATIVAGRNPASKRWPDANPNLVEIRPGAWANRDE